MSGRESLECGACPGAQGWLAQYANECFNISRISLAILYYISRPSVGDVTHSHCRNVSHETTASSISDLSELHSIPISIITDNMLFVFTFYYT